MSYERPFADRAAAILDRLPQLDRLLPFVGSAFDEPNLDRLRVMVVGVNSYISEDDWPNRDPSWFRGWFREARWPFYRGARRDSMQLIAGLGGSRIMGSLTVQWPESFYATNAIKVYLTEATGRKAAQVRSDMMSEHAELFRREVDLMAKHAVLPHLVLIFGVPFWRYACDAFRTASGYAHLNVRSYEHASGPCLHFANRLRFGWRTGEQTTLLLRLRHPAAPTKRGSPDWLLAQPEMRRLAELAT